MLKEAVSGSTTSETIEFATRLGVISEFASVSNANTRFAEMSTGFLQRRAENVIRASGLSAWTTNFRVAVGMEILSKIHNSRIPFNKLNDKIQNMLTEYGITSKEWDIIRATEPQNIKGANFLSMDNIYKADENLGYKLKEFK